MRRYGVVFNTNAVFRRYRCGARSEPDVARGYIHFAAAVRHRIYANITNFVSKKGPGFVGELEIAILASKQINSRPW